jgi:Fe-S-cluster-containing hydrogenase component 2
MENARKMPGKTSNKETMDIYELLLEASEKMRKEKRAELLRSVGVKEFFEDGSIKIDMKTCKGVECKLCIEVCPTNALYWKAGEIGIIEELCVYCTSCVLNCMVDDCIEVKRKRPNGETETFSRPQDVFILLENINSRNRIKAIKMLFPDEETYLKRYGKHFFGLKKKNKGKVSS